MQPFNSEERPPYPAEPFVGDLHTLSTLKHPGGRIGHDGLVGLSPDFAKVACDIEAIERALQSALDELLPRLHEAISEGTLDPLLPSPPVNHAFHTLVETAIAVYPPGTCDIAKRVLPDSMKEQIREICYRGECAMEQHYAQTALDWLDAKGDRAVQSIVEKAERRLREEFGDARVERNGKEVQIARRIERLRGLLTPPHDEPFQYFDNYLDMTTHGESVMVRRVAAAINREEINLTFVGSGALDLTGDLLTITAPSFCRVNVTCVEKNPVSWDLARRFLEFKEELGIIEPGSKRIILSDAEELSYGNDKAFLEKDSFVLTDILFLASMLSPCTKDRVLEQATGMAAIFIRDGYGLVGELLYPPVDKALFDRHGFVPSWVCHPAHQLDNGNVPPEELSLTHVVPDSVVNSTWIALNRSLDVYSSAC